MTAGTGPTSLTRAPAIRSEEEEEEEEIKDNTEVNNVKAGIQDSDVRLEDSRDGK